VLADVLFIHSVAASYLRSAALTPGATAFGVADKCRDYYANHSGPGYALCALSFETLGHISLGAVQSLCEATRAAFPRPGN
jgi:hypothetical protein